jgi:hypothetical protein
MMGEASGRDGGSPYYGVAVTEYFRATSPGAQCRVTKEFRNRESKSEIVYPALLEPFPFYYYSSFAALLIATLQGLMPRGQGDPIMR